MFPLYLIGIFSNRRNSSFKSDSFEFGNNSQQKTGFLSFSKKVSQKEVSQNMFKMDFKDICIFDHCLSQNFISENGFCLYQSFLFTHLCSSRELWSEYTVSKQIRRAEEEEFQHFPSKQHTHCVL